jgi:D-3-phosphoglycerate dehydrogenase
MKLLVADKLEEEALASFRGIAGLEVVSNPSLSKDELASVLGDVHILVVRSKEVRRPAIEAGRKLALIVRAGAGTNTIDVEAASERGVYVANCPGKNAIAVAELAIGMILALDRRIPEATRSLMAGKWEKAEFGKADGLFGKRIGVVGTGAIGREVITRARALGMIPHAWSRSLTDASARELGVTRAPSIEALASVSDVFTIHLPLKGDTRNVISARVFEALPKRAIVVNTARAEVVDYPALIAAMESRHLRVALDVFPGEPEGGKGSFAHEILQHPSVVATPHIGASTQQAQLAIAAETVRIVRSFLETGEVPNCVNIAAKSPARCQLVVRHFDRVGVLANVLAVIKQHGINVEEMTNVPFEGNKAACAKIRLAQFPSTECLRGIETSSPDVIHVEAIPV